jgi:hypothetical protein
MRILITDITDMQPGMHCVAGWCNAQQKMVRPLPSGTHWSAALIAQLGLAVGSSIEVSPTGRVHPGSFPHSTEDLDIIADQIKIVDKVSPSEVVLLVPQSGTNLSDAFGGHLKLEKEFQGKAQKLWVPRGAQCPSLVGINRPKGSVSLSETVYGTDPPKLRAAIATDEGGFQSVEVAVSCSELKNEWRKNGLEAARAALPTSDTWHLRLGLARAFAALPDQCSLMLNGVL